MDIIEATAKPIPLLAMPFSVTTTFPVVAPAGTVAEIFESDQHVPQMTAGVPLKVTVLAPCVSPNDPPLMFTSAPTPPDAGDTLLMTGVGSTVKGTPLLDTPFTRTTISPDEAKSGTGTVMLV